MNQSNHKCFNSKVISYIAHYITLVTQPISLNEPLNNCVLTVGDAENKT